MATMSGFPSLQASTPQQKRTIKSRIPRPFDEPSKAKPHTAVDGCCCWLEAHFRLFCLVLPDQHSRRVLTRSALTRRPPPPFFSPFNCQTEADAAPFSLTGDTRGLISSETARRHRKARRQETAANVGLRSKTNFNVKCPLEPDGCGVTRRHQNTQIPLVSSLPFAGASTHWSLCCVTQPRGTHTELHSSAHGVALIHIT